MMIRERRDVADLTLRDPTKAKTQDWHPVLDTYARGVQLMSRLSENNPRSWLYAANTHGIPVGTPSRPLWAQCAHASWSFLPWHRGYLAWFESTIQMLTGDEEWRLPYWDYSTPGDEVDRTLPVEFSVETRTVDEQVVPNPLYSPERAVDPLPVHRIGIVDALAQTRYVRTFPEFGFGGTDRIGEYGADTLEMEPHNYVHVDVGGLSGLMRSTATAGRDPIFWLHHANIDRLWEVWKNLPGSIALTEPGAAPRMLVTQWQSAIFVFGEARSPSTYTMDDIEDPRTLGYIYESIELPIGLAAEIKEKRKTRVEAERRMTLDGSETAWEPVAATFNLTSGEERDVSFASAARSLRDVPSAGLRIGLAGVRATDPHAVYVVEVRATPDAQAHRAGRFSTFGLAGTPETEERSYVVDASSVLPLLWEEGWSDGPLWVRVAPEEGHADSEDADKAISIRQVTVYARTP
jgi:tyrosinase